MAEKRKESTKRFGARYGRHLKEKAAEIEKGFRCRNKCPYCRKKNVKKMAIGIWFCRACKTKFTGKAYSIGKGPAAKEDILNKDIIKKLDTTEKDVKGVE